MSSLAQDELGHAAALYGLLADAHRLRPGCARLRPRARRVPPLPAARPRPGRLGDDDRPTLPVRQRRRDPARGAGRGQRGRRSPSSSGSSSARSAITGCTPRPGSTRLARRDGEPRERLLAALETLAPDAATVFTPLPDEPELDRGRHPRRADGRARGALARVDRPVARGVSACRCRRPPATRCAAGSTMASRSAGCGASSPRSDAPTPERPGERGRDPDRHRAAAGRRDSADRGRSDDADRRVPSTSTPSARALAEVMDPELPMLSVVDLGIVHRRRGRRPRRRRSGSRSCRRSSAARRSSSSRRRSRIGLPRSAGPSRSTATFEVPWTSERISPAGRRALLAAGIAPPTAAIANGDGATLIDLEPRVPCPHCGSRRTTLENVFGPTQCRTIRYCADCRQPFEAIKPV